MHGQELTTDLTSECADALAKLMVAQAQDCFVAKAIRDAKANGLVAKLAMQCSELYLGISK